MTERWLPVVGYEGRYEVSDLGRVRRVTRTFMRPRRGPRTIQQMVLKPQKGTSAAGGHLRVSLSKPRNGVNHQIKMSVHRLVLFAFVGAPPAGHIACHNDGDPENNRLSNLRWDTPHENNLDTLRHGHHPGAAKTHCPQGHPLSGGNVYLTSAKHRQCRECHRIRQAEYKRQKRAEAAAA